MALTGCHVSDVAQLRIFGEICFYSLYFFGHFFPILSSPNTPDMQNEALFIFFKNIIVLGLAPPWGILFLFYFVQFTINGSLRNFTILVKRPVATLRRCELTL
jgi:hypothetical protein